MAGSDVSIKLENAQQIEAMLTGLGLDMKDLRGAMADVGTSAKKFFGGQVFASRGEVIGESWQRLNDKYAAQKARKWPGRPLLIRTGLMQRSFSYSTTPMSVTVTNTAPYFKYHQSTAARKKLPRRAMIGISTTMQSDVTNIIALALAKKIQQRTGK